MGSSPPSRPPYPSDATKSQSAASKPVYFCSRATKEKQRGCLRQLLGWQDFRAKVSSTAGWMIPVRCPVTLGPGSCSSTSEHDIVSTVDMVNPKKETGLEHFSRLNCSIFIHEPTSNTPQAHLILLAGWMGCPIRALAKYAVGYEKLYPSARIVVITTSAIDAAFRTHAANVERIAPVLDAISALPPGAKFFLHAFSNGGSWTSTLIAAEYRAKTGKALPTTAMILDSAPGKATYTATIRAFAVSLPKNILAQIVGGIILRMFWSGYRFAYWISRKADLVARTRADLNNNLLFDTNMPRLYVYSVADVMVSWLHVGEHAEEAAKLGYTVHKKKFQGSGHCAHLMVDPVRYWGFVQQFYGAGS